MVSAFQLKTCIVLSDDEPTLGKQQRLKSSVILVLLNFDVEKVGTKSFEGASTFKLTSNPFSMKVSIAGG